MKDGKLGKMADAAEMLWTVVANVSSGDWTKQNKMWQEAAERWRDNYFKVLKECHLIPPHQETIDKDNQ